MKFEINDKVQKQIISVCNSILSEEMDIFEGCRLIVSLSLSLNESEELRENEIFYIFRGVDSEADRFAFGDARKRYNPTYLKQLDKEMYDCINFYKESIFEECNNLIKFLNNLPKQ